MFKINYLPYHLLVPPNSDNHDQSENSIIVSIWAQQYTNCHAFDGDQITDTRPS